MKKDLMTALLFLTALPFFAQAQLPALSTNSLSITVAKGEKASESIKLENNGTQAIGFTTTNAFPLSLYSIEWAQIEGWEDVPINPDRNTLSFDNNGNADVQIDFDFREVITGIEFTVLTIDLDGALNLSVRQNLLPFSTESFSIDTNNIGYRLEEDRLTVTWQSASAPTEQLYDLEFQVQIFENSEIRYLYRYMDGATADDAFVGYDLNGDFDLTDPKNADKIKFSDGATTLANNSMLVFTPVSLITSSLEEGMVPANSSIPLTISVDDTDPDHEVEEGSYNLGVHWSDGSQSMLTVNVAVEDRNQSLTAGASELLLSAAAGSLTKDSVVLTNDGNVAVDYSIVDLNAQSAQNYTWTNTTFHWRDAVSEEFVPSNARDSLNRGWSDLMPLGFAFPFFGTYHTNFSISVDGYISLGETANLQFNNNFSTPNRVIAPFMQDMYYDRNSRISVSGDKRKTVVTWENMKGEEGDDQTFQLILESNGSITFQYLRLEGTNGWTNSKFRDAFQHIAGQPLQDRPAGSATAIGLLDDTFLQDRFINNTLDYRDGPDRGTFYEKEVILYEDEVGRDRITNRVEVIQIVEIYDDPLLNQAFKYTPSATPVTVSPRLGSLDAGQTLEIVAIGDARNLSAGASYTNDYSVVVADDPKTDPTEDLEVEFKVDFNVIAPSSAALVLDSDNDGQSDMAELLAGTDELNADSTFSVNLDGSRSIKWTEPGIGLQLDRTYTIWFTTNLLEGWTELTQVSNGTRFTDTEHNDVPAIYYKVTVD